MNISALKTSKFSLLVLGVALVLICGLITQDLIRVPWVETTRRKFLLYNGPTVELFGDRKLEQTFTANYPGLAQIDILIKENNVAGRPMHLHLKNTCNAQTDIARVTKNLPVIKDFAFYPFAFTPLDNSAGQPYCLVLEAPQANADAAVQLPLSAGDLYPYGLLTINSPPAEGKKNSVLQNNAGASFPYKIFLPLVMQGQDTGLEEDMGFRLYYAGFLLPTTQVFAARLTANKPLVWGQPWFYGGLAATYAILLAALFYAARQTGRGDKKKKP